MNRLRVSDFGFWMQREMPGATRRVRRSAGLTDPIHDAPSALRPHHACQKGFSLLEMAVAAAVTSIIMLGIGSAMLLAGRAMPDVHSPTSDCIAGADAVEPMMSELQYAVAINQRSARMIEFTVADRNGDGTPEVIRYEWSGVAGAALTRRYNAGTAVEVLANVRDFSLSYDLQTISTQIPQGNESAETLLTSYSSSQNYDDYPIKRLEWYSEYFRPALPANTVSWKVTRVQFYAKTALGAGGQITVQLQRPTAGGLPSGVVLEERTLSSSSLSWLWYLLKELTYTQVSGLSPQQGLCLVLRWISGDDAACKFLGQDQGVTAPNLALLTSTDKAVSWSLRSGESLLFAVYGTVTTDGTPQIHNTYYLNGVGIRLRTGTDNQATVQTGVRILNRPEVTQ